jgi:hypothetical protein
MELKTHLLDILNLKMPVYIEFGFPQAIVALVDPGHRPAQNALGKNRKDKQLWIYGLPSTVLDLCGYGEFSAPAGSPARPAALPRPAALTSLRDEGVLVGGQQRTDDGQAVGRWDCPPAAWIRQARTSSTVRSG